MLFHQGSHQYSSSVFFFHERKPIKRKKKPFPVFKETQKISHFSFSNKVHFLVHGRIRRFYGSWIALYFSNWCKKKFAHARKINVYLLLIEWLSNLRLMREPPVVIVHVCLGNIIFIIVFFRYFVVKLFNLNRLSLIHVL